MEILDLIVSKACAFASIDFKDDEDRINNAIKAGHDVIRISYFHGKLEGALGYDIGACLNGEHIDNGHSSYKEGINDAEVKGYPNKLKAFLWDNEGPRGLIVDSTVPEDMAFAQENFDRKEQYL